MVTCNEPTKMENAADAMVLSLPNDPARALPISRFLRAVLEDGVGSFVGSPSKRFPSFSRNAWVLWRNWTR
jgi:hypothetical protein